MAEAAEHLSAATGKSIHYVDMTSAEKQKPWLEAGYPPSRAGAVAQLFEERQGLGHSTVDLSTHRRFDIEATCFAQFAHCTAAVFRGETQYDATPG
jgi:hypothetical protein